MGMGQTYSPIDRQLSLNSRAGTLRYGLRALMLCVFEKDPEPHVFIYTAISRLSHGKERFMSSDLRSGHLHRTHQGNEWQGHRAVEGTGSEIPALEPSLDPPRILQAKHRPQAAWLSGQHIAQAQFWSLASHEHQQNRERPFSTSLPKRV